MKSEKASKVPFGGGALDRRGGGGAANGSGALFGCIGAGADATEQRAGPVRGAAAAAPVERAAPEGDLRRLLGLQAMT